MAVVVARRGDGDAAAVRRELDRVAALAERQENAQVEPRALAVAKRGAGDASIAVLPLDVSGSQDETADLAVDLRDELIESPIPGTQPYFVGQQALWAGMQELTKEDLESAERIGFPVVLLILLAVFGSLAAASLPLALGFVSVAVTGAAIFFLSRLTPMSVFVTNVASMLGIGVAVDYSLFVLARYREEVRAGRPPVDARRTSLRTSGLAVAFSGVTVILSLAGLWLVDSTTIRSMAMGAIIVVAVSILAAVTLLPVLMRLFGRRVYERGRIARGLARFSTLQRRRRRRRGSTAPGAAAAPGFWERWTLRVTRRPWAAALGSAAVLIVLALPALSLDFGNGALRQFPEGNDTREGAELAARELGPGSSGPTQVIADLDSGRVSDPGNRAALRAYGTELSRDPEVASVAPPRVSADGRSALFVVVPRDDPESDHVDALVDRLRADSGALTGVAEVDVGGATAFNSDFTELVSGSMWKILLFVLVFSYLVLFVLLRSVLLPLKAVLVNLLSVGAAYGVLVAVFQWGWLDGVLGFESLGYVNAMTPPFLLAIVFGLSMDYEVFLLSRIRERYDATGDTTGRCRGAARQRRDDLECSADHGRRLRGVRRHRHALDQGDRPGAVGGDRARRDAGAADPRPGDDGDHGPLELVAARAGGARPPARRLRHRRRAGALTPRAVHAVAANSRRPDLWSSHDTKSGPWARFERRGGLSRRASASARGRRAARRARRRARRSESAPARACRGRGA